MHTDSLFPSSMKTAMENDSKAVSPGRSIRQPANKKDGKKEKGHWLCLQANKQTTYSQIETTAEDEHNLFIK